MIAYALVMTEPLAQKRREQTKIETDKLPFEVKEWFGIRSYVGDCGCSIAHLRMLMDAYKKGEELLCFEDDVRINDVPLLMKQLDAALKDDYVDILYLSIHPPIFPKDRILEEHGDWLRISGVWGSHAILYKKRAIQKLVSILDSDGTCGGNGRLKNNNIDVTMTREIHPHFNCVVGKELAVTMYGGPSLRVDKEREADVHEQTLTRFEELKKRFYNKTEV